MKRSTMVKSALWVLTAMAAVVAASRFLRGLGATSNLTDSTPWGFWIGFDVMAGVALAAGGFVLAGAVYVFRLEKFRPLLRATVLTAFLGYVAVATGLLFDLGVPWHIWHPMIYWNHHSVLFEVAMCVMAYLTVLALEFAPAALEHKFFQWGPFPKIYDILKRLTVPLVILGIMLSTLHQSSLGSLFLIMPFRVHPLWYSPLLPLLFFVSAIGLGFMMVALENFVSGWVYKHKVRMDLLGPLGGAAAIALGLYAAIRVVDLMARGSLVIDGSWESIWFLMEIGFSAVIPAVLLAIPAVRNNGRALFAIAASVVFGMVIYRLNISIITMERWPGTAYFPSMIEFMVSIGIVSGLALVFMYFVENLQVFEEHEAVEGHIYQTADDVLGEVEEDAEPPRGVVPGTVGGTLSAWLWGWSPFQKAEFSSTTRTWYGDPLIGGIRKYSLLVVIGAALTAAVLPTQAIFGFNFQEDPVRPARLQEDGHTLKIDGNRAAEHVFFDHEEHKIRLGDRDGCVKCHHMSIPEDLATPCGTCHSDMYKEVSIFDHDYHQEYYGNSKGCVECHPGGSKDPKDIKTCVSCHQDMWPDKTPGEKIDYMAPSYVDAMHDKCAACHEEEAKRLRRPELGLCSACHVNHGSEAR